MDPKKALPNLSDRTPYYATYGNLLLIEHPPEMGPLDLYFIFQKPGVIAFDRWNVWGHAAGTTILAPVIESPLGDARGKTTRQAMQEFRDLCPRLHELCVVESKDAPREVEWIQYLASCEKLTPRRIRIRDKDPLEEHLKAAVAGLPEDKRELASCLDGYSYDGHRSPIHQTILWSVFNGLWCDSISRSGPRTPATLGCWSAPATVAITEVMNVLEGTLRRLLARVGELNIPQSVIHKQAMLGAEQAVAKGGSDADVRIGKICAIMDLMDEHGFIGAPVANLAATKKMAPPKKRKTRRTWMAVLIENDFDLIEKADKILPQKPWFDSEEKSNGSKEKPNDKKDNSKWGQLHQQVLAKLDRAGEKRVPRPSVATVRRTVLRLKAAQKLPKKVSKKVSK